MGYRIAKACDLSTSPPLSSRARVVLSRMAWATLDKPTATQAAAEYWRGWEYLTLPWDDGTRSANALKSIAQRSLNELTRAGYIKPLGTAHLGHRQRYVITLDY